MKCESAALEDCGRTLTGRWQESERTVTLVPVLVPAKPIFPPKALAFRHQRTGASCRTRTFSLSVLLQSATVPPQELASIRTEFLRQYRVFERLSTVRSKNVHRLPSGLSEK